jgi:hypothetical protein
MFLFTTPPVQDGSQPAQAQAASKPAIEAIRRGAEKTGVNFDYLLRTAQRESALDPAAKARTSSASGLFQFIEQTWLGLVRDSGGEHGLGDYAKAIAPQGSGRLSVEDPAAKREILSLRHDPSTAAVMAGVLTRKNAETLTSALGRSPNDGELYAAHVLGAKGASDLIRGAQADPTGSAAQAFPDASAANRSIFFDKSGRARGFGEVYAVLAGNNTSEGAVSSPYASSPSASSGPSSAPLAYASDDGPAMFSLFRTEGRRGPVSEAVAKLWAMPERPAAQPVSSAPSFFPRGNGNETSNGRAATPVPASGSVVAPTPAPTSVGAAVSSQPALQPGSVNALPQRAPGPNGRPSVLDPNTSLSQAATRRAQPPRAPLDLSSFMAWRAS